MEQLVTSNFKLGIIAGGQLGKMLALAASNWCMSSNQSGLLSIYNSRHFYFKIS